MKAILQRVSHASVNVGTERVGEIEKGLMVLLGVADDDTDTDLVYILEKTLNLRIFSDDAGRMNLSLLDIGGGLLVISQFTLIADTRKGRRPSFVHAMEPVRASRMVDDFVARAKTRVSNVQTGRFGADMNVALLNQGPVTIILDSKN